MDANASSAHKNKRSGLSAAEFQRNLYNWFENRGVLDELRTRLRHQMIMALKDTSLRPSPSRRLKSNLSPKIQAIDLLIAEFLLQQHHHYTLSVFTSEVPLLRSMPEFKMSRTHISADGDTVGESMPRFHHQDVKDIMEILGLPLDTEVGNRIYLQYRDDSENTALLTCVVQNVSHVLKSVSQTGEKKVLSDPNGTGRTQDSKSNTKHEYPDFSNKDSNSAKQVADLYNAEMQEVLYQSRLKSQHIKQLQEEIRRFQDCEVKRVRKEEEEKYKKKLLGRESQMQADIRRREEELTEKLKDAEDRLARQQQNLECDLQTKQKQLQEQHMQVAHKIQQVEEHAEKLKQEEKMIEETKRKEALLLAEKTGELDTRARQLRQEFERLNAERETLTYMQRELEENRLRLVEASRSLVHSQSQASFLHNLQQQCAHLHHELDATRVRLDNLTEIQSKNSSHSKASFCHHCSVEKVDKGLQTTLPLPMAAVAERLPTQDEALELGDMRPQLHQHQYLMDLMHKVQQENQELRGHTQQQRLRIDELTSNAALLANQLEDAHAALTLLSNRPTPEYGPHILPSLLLPQVSGTTTVPPVVALPPPPAPSLQPHAPDHALRTEHSHQTGVGKEVSCAQSPSVSQQVTQSLPASPKHPSLHHRREWRKKPTRHFMVHNNTTSSDETSPTEEILREARHRLRKLEEESEAVDRSYRDFQLRHSESLAKTRSALFHPSVQPAHFQQQSSNLSYGIFTPSKPMYSAATGGGQNSHTPFIFRNTKYDDKPQFSDQTLFRNERVPPFQCTKRCSNQFAFPPQLQTLGTVDSTGKFFSDRITTQYPLNSIGSELSASSRYAAGTTVPHADSRFTLQSQPSTGSDFQSRVSHQQKDKIDSANSRTERRGSVLHTKLLYTQSSASFDPHIRTPYQARNVSFGNSLKTITIYKSPQVSALAGSVANQDSSQKELNDKTSEDINLKSADDAAASSQKTGKVASLSRSVSLTQSLSGSNRWGEAFLIKESDKVPAGMAYSSTSSTQDDDHIASQFQKNNSYRDIHDENAKISVTKRLSDESIWKIQHKASSYPSQSLGSEFILKETKSADEDMADKTCLKDNQRLELNELQAEKLFPVSDISALSSRETGSHLSSRTTLNTGSLSTETDFQPVLAASHISSTIFSSDSKDLNIEHVSNDGSFLTDLNMCTEEAANKPVSISSVGTVPIQKEDVLSEISGSGTQTTVQKQAVKIVKDSDTVTSNIQDIIENVGKDTGINKGDKNSPVEILDVESSGTAQCTLIVPDEVDQNRCTITTNNQENVQDLVKERHAKTDQRELSECVLEGTKSREDFPSASEEQDSDKDQKYTSHEAVSVTDSSDQAISVGKQSNRDDSNEDDFW